MDDYSSPSQGKQRGRFSRSRSGRNPAWGRRLFFPILALLVGLVLQWIDTQKDPARGPAAGGAATTAGDISGQVVKIADGDTITVLDDDHREHRIRLFGIDAPEKAQPFGTKAGAALGAKVFGQNVRVDVADTDQYGRAVGKVYLGDRFINREMIAEGWAWHYRQYDKSADLDDAEAVARQQKLGLWKDAHPLPPWEFRREKRHHEKSTP